VATVDWHGRVGWGRLALDFLCFRRGCVGSRTIKASIIFANLASCCASRACWSCIISIIFSVCFSNLSTIDSVRDVKREVQSSLVKIVPPEAAVALEWVDDASIACVRLSGSPVV
jgi:hypothetical protein